MLAKKNLGLLSIIGLTIALTASLILFAYAWYERGFDKHFTEGDKIYRVITKHGEGDYFASTFSAAGDAYANVPAIEDHTLFIASSNAIIEANDNSYTIPEFVIADNRFLDFFDIRMIVGKKEYLDEPNTVFITHDLSKRMFPFEDPIGKNILFRKFEGNASDTLGFFTIKGILQPLPTQSHFGYEMIFSQKGNLDWFMKHVKGSKSLGGKLYVKINNISQLSGIETAFPLLLEPFLGTKHGPPLRDFSIKLQPLHNIHFHTGLNGESRPTVRNSQLNLLLSIGILIYLLALANYSNLFLSQINSTRRRTGIMKSIGGDTKQVLAFSVWQILPGLVLSLLISLTIVFIVVPLFPMLLPSHLTTWNSLMPIFLVGIALIGFIFISTILMAMFRLKHEQVIKSFSSQLGGKNGNLWGNKILITFQFVVVIMLISFSILIRKQIHFIQQKDLGFSPQNVMIWSIPSFNPNGRVLCNAIGEILGINAVSTAHHYPGAQILNTTLKIEGHEFSFNYGFIEPDALNVLNIKVNQQIDQEMKDGGWVINQTFFDQLQSVFGKEKVLNNDFVFENDDPQSPKLDFQIRAITDDFHYHSLYDPLQNFAFLLRRPENGFNRFLLVKTASEHTESVIKKVNEEMSVLYPGIPPQYFFLDDKLSEQYRADQKLYAFISRLSMLAIFIAALGLFSLSVYSAQKRIKEIGIRKVNGAKLANLMFLLNKDYMKWISIAFMVAVVFSNYAMNKWLQNFAYKTDLSWWIFAMAGVLALVIAMLTVSFQSWKAANRNPVESLRYE